MCWETSPLWLTYCVSRYFSHCVLIWLSLCECPCPNLFFPPKALFLLLSLLFISSFLFFPCLPPLYCKKNNDYTSHIPPPPLKYVPPKAWANLQQGVLPTIPLIYLHETREVLRKRMVGLMLFGTKSPNPVGQELEGGCVILKKVTAYPFTEMFIKEQIIFIPKSVHYSS